MTANTAQLGKPNHPYHHHHAWQIQHVSANNIVDIFDFCKELSHYLCSGIDEILDLEKISRGNGPFFSISSWRIECSFLEMFSIVKILKKKFSFSSRNSRFWRKFLFLFSIEWDFANRFSSRESKFSEKIHFFLSILPSISLPIMVRNHILLFGWILTSSILQKGKVFDKDSSVLLSNILTSVNKGTLVMVFSDTQSLFWNWTSEVRTPLCGGDNF